MIEMMETATGNQLAMRLSGQVMQDDYDKVLIPAIEMALKEHDRLPGTG